MKIKDLINENNECFHFFLRAGLIDKSKLNYYKIWVYYSNLCGMSKMDRYTFTAEALGISERTVINAVSFIENDVF
jgi:hypothetical protein